MTNMTSHFTGKATVQTNFSLDDTPGHEMSLMEVSGLQSSSDNHWKDAKIHYWVSLDLMAEAPKANSPVILSPGSTMATRRLRKPMIPAHSNGAACSASNTPAEEKQNRSAPRQTQHILRSRCNR